MTPHLTHEQLCDIILASAQDGLIEVPGNLEKHLQSCPGCAQELTSLGTSLFLFRDSAQSFARQEYAKLVGGNPPLHSRFLFRPIQWVAVAAFLAAAVIPFNLRRQQAPSPVPATVTQPKHTLESDEALLDEVNQALSASIPSPMQPLADPTAGTTQSPSISTQRKN